MDVSGRVHFPPHRHRRRYLSRRELAESPMPPSVSVVPQIECPCPTTHLCYKGKCYKKITTPISTLPQKECPQPCASSQLCYHGKCYEKKRPQPISTLPQKEPISTLP